jgi:hypothetical protein
MTQATKTDCVDTTIAEIHRTRQCISDQFGGDIHAITEDARNRQERSGRQTVSYAETVKPVLEPIGMPAGDKKN